jgi:hypothetical protein
MQTKNSSVVFSPEVCPESKARFEALAVSANCRVRVGLQSFGELRCRGCRLKAFRPSPAEMTDEHFKSGSAGVDATRPPYFRPKGILALVGNEVAFSVGKRLPRNP